MPNFDLREVTLAQKSTLRLLAGGLLLEDGGHGMGP
jgi:hypothetical protein